MILWDVRSTLAVIFTYFTENRKLKALPALRKGFADHRAEFRPADEKYRGIFPRLIDAYTRAKADQAGVPGPYRVGIMWQREIDSHCGELAAVLRDGDADKLRALMDNFHREKISLGLQGNSEWANIQRPFYKYLYVNTWYAFYRIYEELAGKQPPLQYPMVGNPAGLYHDGRVIPFHAIRYHYSAREMLNLLGETGHPVVAEIGSGLGGQAHALLANAERPVTYLCLDIPEVLIVASYFLMAALPEKKFLLYGEAPPDAANFQQYDVILMPNFVLPQLGEQSVDLFFNNSSFSEMDSETVREYLRQIERIGRGYFLHINHNTAFNWREDGREFHNLPGTQVVPDPTVFKKLYQYHWPLNTLPEELYYKGAGFLAFLYEKRRPGPPEMKG
ncbi:MAG: hypothetical protein A2Z05_07310 [Chloroflexi bacterium RBG_16_60_22]|nr:MAG: hypothetical protein A2Z05_07310 [Chloroflexi bacterium RBG_16_60_22]